MIYVGFEALIPVVMKSCASWDVTPCSPFKTIDVLDKYIASIFRFEKKIQARNESDSRWQTEPMN
jgi:hypothetical protein